LAEFTPRIVAVDAPVTALQREIEQLRTRVEEMRLHQRKLERNAEDKRDRMRRYEERLGKVRNAREDSAARAEFDLIRKAADADDTETLELMDQVRRNELKLDDLEKKLVQADQSATPQREELVAARGAVEAELADLRVRRASAMERLPNQASRLYERVRAGRSRVIITTLTVDGACGHCFGIVPLQQQSEVKAGRALHRCEACGVILHPGV